MTSFVRKVIHTTSSPKPMGPYSQAVNINGTLYLSGQIGLDPSTMTLVPGGVEAECKQVLTNIGEVLKAAGGDFSNVVKTTVLLAKMDDFNPINGIYKQFFKEPYPVRATYQVVQLPGEKVYIYQAVNVNGTLYISGQVGFDPSTMTLVRGGVEAECKQALTNVGEILKAAGGDFSNVVKTTVLLAKMDDFNAINEIYKEFFKEPYPARATYQVVQLPGKANIEIECVAVIGKIIEEK